MVPLQLPQFQWVFFIAEVSQFKVHQALIQVRQSLCADSEKIQHERIFKNQIKTKSTNKHQFIKNAYKTSKQEQDSGIG